MKCKASLFVITALAVTGCGGSSSSGTDNTAKPDANSVAGTAAIGAAISDAPVSARCQDGSGFLSGVTTGADGRFKGEVGGGALPCALSIQAADGTTYHSLAIAGETTNITPLTDLVIALTGEDPAQWFINGDLLRAAEIIPQRTRELVAALTEGGYSVPENLDPIRSDLAIGDSHDKVLDELGEAIEGSVAFEELLTLVRDGNLNQIPQAPVNVASPAPDPNADEENESTTVNFSACYNPDLYRDGATREIRSRVLDDNSPLSFSNEKRTISGQTTFKDRTVTAEEIQRTVVFDDGTSSTSTQTSFYTIDLATGSATAFGSTTSSMELVYNPPLETVFDIGLNETHTHEYTISANETSTQNIRIEQTFLGIETIQVAGRAIEACKMHYRDEQLNAESGAVEGANESIGWRSVGTGISLKINVPPNNNVSDPAGADLNDFIPYSELESATSNGQVIF